MWIEAAVTGQVQETVSVGLLIDDTARRLIACVELAAEDGRYALALHFDMAQVMAVGHDERADLLRGSLAAAILQKHRGARGIEDVRAVQDVQHVAWPVALPGKQGVERNLVQGAMRNDASQLLTVQAAN